MRSADALSFSDSNGLAGANVRQMIYLPAGPANFHGFCFGMLRKAEGKRQLAGRKIAGSTADHLRLHLTRGCSSYHRSDAIAIGFIADEFNAQALVGFGGAGSFVVKKIYRTAIRGQQQVEASIVVKISVGSSTANTGRSKGGSGRFSNLHKISFAHVAKQMRRHGIFPVGLHALNTGVDVTVGDKNVGPAVEIKIKKEASEAQSEQGSVTDFGAWRFIDKKTFTLVVVERKHLIGEIRDEDAWCAGAIVIRGIHAHTGARDAVLAESDSRNYGLFAESAICIVAIKLVW